MEVNPPVTANTVFSAEYDRSQLPDLLKFYYTWIFPYDKYYEWLCYDEESFSNREFSFTLEDDVYVRYQSYDSCTALKEGIRKNCPYKIDIGAIFNHRPKFHKSIQPGNFRAENKELVFDIDMTDYDDIRTCCSDANICHKCWTFMKIAIKIIDRALREDFGFSHCLWVYSGRRGVHCWVCDSQARKLSQPARTAIAEYLTLIKGNEQQVKKVMLKQPIHPSIKYALDIIDEYMETLVKEQDFLSSEERWEKVLRCIPKKHSSTLQSEWKENYGTSWKRWQRMESEIGKDVDDRVLKEVRLQYTYPRLDVNVTKGLNHLLKSPLCIHPKTGRVCVPISLSEVDDFDPFNVPTVSQLCHEFEARNEGKKDYHCTSLAPYMRTFCDFVTKLKSASSLERKRSSGHRDDLSF